MQSAKDSWAGRCSAARLPHKKVREELRDTNLISLRLQHVRFTGSLPAAEGSGPPSYFPRTSYLSNFMISGACERGEFYCEINFFCCEQNDRPLREEFF